jgi:ParB family chromosome partitioning protein
MAEERSRLGRGLAALIGDVGAETPAAERVRAVPAGASQKRVPIEHVRANPRNPRRTFSEAELEELAASIRERGVIQPIVVRARKGEKGGPDQFEIIAGERRWRASQRANLHEVPVVVIEATDAQALEIAIVENVQRSDLNAIEEAAGYQALMDQFKHSQDDVAKIVGKSRPHIANTLRLLKLPDSVQSLVKSGKISAGHARLLVGHPKAEALALEIGGRGLSVRQVEAMLREEAAAPTGGTSKPAAPVKDADTRALEKRLSDELGLKVTIDHKGEGGTVSIRYSKLDQLDEVVRRLNLGH